MSKPETKLGQERLVRALLEHGGLLPLAVLLEITVELEALRGLVRKLGLTLKGGFRIDRAPASILASRLAECRAANQLDAICALLLARAGKSVATEPNGAEARDATDLQPVLRLREQEIEGLQAEVAKKREAATRWRQRKAELNRSLRECRMRLAQARTENEELESRMAQPPAPAVPPDQEHRIHELERDLEELEQNEEAQRRRVAELSSENRGLREQIEELSARRPKGWRKKKAAPPPPLPERFRLPHFGKEFEKSLENKERRAVEAAYRAIWLFCTEGPSYPGLEVKQLEGQDLWSLRASLKLRVYFRPREDGDLDLIALGDREDQRTTLRRLKDRS